MTPYDPTKIPSHVSPTSFLRHTAQYSIIKPTAFAKSPKSCCCGSSYSNACGGYGYISSGEFRGVCGILHAGRVNSEKKHTFEGSRSTFPVKPCPGAEASHAPAMHASISGKQPRHACHVLLFTPLQPSPAATSVPADIDNGRIRRLKKALLETYIFVYNSDSRHVSLAKVKSQCNSPIYAPF
jgi:hypothetical protein